MPPPASVTACPPREVSGLTPSTARDFFLRNADKLVSFLVLAPLKDNEERGKAVRGGWKGIDLVRDEMYLSFRIIVYLLRSYI